MKQTLKGVLSSALVFPGVGHLVLRAWKRGFLFILLSLCCITAVAWVLVPLVSGIMNDLVAGDLTSDQAQIRAVIHERMLDGGGETLGLAGWSLIALWAVALIDVFLLGRKQDRQLKAK